MYKNLAIIVSLTIAPVVKGNASNHDYFDTRIKCESVLYDFNQSRLINPNKQPRKKQNADAKLLTAKATDTIKKEWLLNNYFNISITDQQLKNELERIINSTKDAAGLKQLFNVLDNDATKVIECVARPLLVEKIFSVKYDSDETIHEPTKELALEDIVSGVYLSAIEQQSTQTVASEQSHELIETPYAFIQHKNNSTYYWPKETELKWIKNNAPTVESIKQSEISIAMEPLRQPTSRNTTTQTNDYWIDAEFQPTGRTGHTSVWTGAELLVWGGLGNDGRQATGKKKLKTGGRYDPITDTWHEIRTDGAPWARMGHTAVWTGTHMIVWGGDGSLVDYDYNLTNTGGKYDPITNTWEEIEPLGYGFGSGQVFNDKTAKRVGHTAVWTGSEMIIYGGKYSPLYQVLEPVQGVALYNPSTDTWRSFWSDLRIEHTAIWTGDQMIVWGGYDGDNYLATGQAFDPSNEESPWSDFDELSSTSAPQPRGHHTAVWTGNDMIVWGGVDDIGRTKSGGRYNPNTKQWTLTKITGAPQARSNHTAVWTGERMIVWGGTQTSGLAKFGGVYDPLTDSWQGITSSNRPDYRKDHTAVWTGKDMIVWGGESASEFLSNGSKYNPANNTWTDVKYYYEHFARRHQSAIWTGSEMIVWGGWNSITASEVNSGYKYNPITNSYKKTSMSNVPIAGSGHTALWNGNEMYVYGGSGNYANKYNPSSDSWGEIAQSPGGTIYSGKAAWTGDKALLWDELQGRIQIYNPEIDSWKNSKQLNGINLYDSSFIWTGSRAIVFGGGYMGPQTNIGGIYDPSTDSWQIIEPQPYIGARHHHAAAWTGTEVLLAGGNYEGEYGARYNPATDQWAAFASINPPLKAIKQAGVWSGQELIVWGGETVDGEYTKISTGYRVNKNGLVTQMTNIGAPDSRANPSAVWTGSAMIISGGDKEGASLYFPHDPDIIFSNSFE